MNEWRDFEGVGHTIGEEGKIHGKLKKETEKKDDIWKPTERKTTANELKLNFAVPCRQREKGLFPKPILWAVNIWKN